MVATTKILSVSLPVADQDAAVAFYTGVLGFEVRYDGEPVPGQRMVEVAPPGSEVSIALLPADSGIPLAVRLETPDADAAHAAVAAADVTVHNPEVLRWPGVPGMFSFTDPDGNGLVFLEPADWGREG